jgi:HNH endonuclease
VIFDYPSHRNERRHGPSGYTSYHSFRPWLRDEFLFRCVYCLKREAWGQVTGDFELDHFRPQSLNADSRVDYLNLVYACRRCNSVKLDQSIDDPFQLLVAGNLAVLLDGQISSGQQDVRRLILQLDLNSPSMARWRVMWMRIVQLAGKKDPVLYRQLTGFPKDLPDLAKLRPPTNSRQKGVSESCHFLRELGSLPGEY